MDKTILTFAMVDMMVHHLGKKINKHFESRLYHNAYKVYGVPRGGVFIAYALRAKFSALEVVDNPADADFIVDDILDSGKTQEHYKTFYRSKPFFAMVEPKTPDEKQWVVFPWEMGDGIVEGLEQNIVRILQFIGEDNTRGGLKETPKRTSDAWKFWCSGYGKKPEDILKSFEDGAENYNELIVVKDIPFYSKCEHHLADFFGTATVGYVPNGKIVGLSKINRLVDMYARRLQVQERLTHQIFDSLTTHLKPKGVGVLIKARHLCMESRGVCQQGHHTITSALGGTVFEDKGRSEFLKLAL